MVQRRVRRRTQAGPAGRRRGGSGPAAHHERGRGARRDPRGERLQAGLLHRAAGRLPDLQVDHRQLVLLRAPPERHRSAQL